MGPSPKFKEKNSVLATRKCFGNDTVRRAASTSSHQIEEIRRFTHPANTQGGAKGQGPGSNLRRFMGQRAVVTAFRRHVGRHGGGPGRTDTGLQGRLLFSPLKKRKVTYLINYTYIIINKHIK